jgi:hypothetical protein
MNNRLVKLVSVAVFGIGLLGKTNQLGAQEVTGQTSPETPGITQEKEQTQPREYSPQGDFYLGIYLYHERTKAGNGKFEFYSQFPGTENGRVFKFSDIKDEKNPITRQYTLNYTNDSFVVTIEGRANPLFFNNWTNSVEGVRIGFPSGGSLRVNRSDPDVQKSLASVEVREFPGGFKAEIVQGAERIYRGARMCMEQELCREGSRVYDGLFSVSFLEEEK